MKPRNPLPRSSKRIRSRKADPTKRQFAKQRDWAYREWIKELACLVCRRRPVDPAHVIPQSLGAPDRKNLVPLCRQCHDSQEGRTAEFEREHKVWLALAALELDERYAAQIDAAF